MFTELILASLAGNLITDLRSCLNLISKTLWGRVDKSSSDSKSTSKASQDTNPSVSKSQLSQDSALASASQFSGHKSPKDLCDKVLEKLQFMEKEGLIFIKKDSKNPPKLYISRLGNACIRSGMTPNEVLNSIARLRGSLHPIYLSSVISLIFLAIDDEISDKFIGFKRTNRSAREILMQDYMNAIERLTPTEKEVLAKAFEITADSIARKMFGLGSLATKRVNSKEKDSNTSQTSTISTSSYKDLEKCRKFLIQAGKSIPKQPLYEDTDLDNRVIAALAVYECRIKKLGVQKISELYHTSRGDVQQLCLATSSNCGKIARFCEVIMDGDNAASILKEPETEEMRIMVDASQSLWVLSPLFRNLTQTLKYGSLGDLIELLDIPAVGLGRARQLYKHGYTSLAKLANADCNELCNKLGSSGFMPKKLAMKLVSAARNKIRDKVDDFEGKYFETQKNCLFYDYDLDQ